MSGLSIRMAALIGTVLVVCAFAPSPATAQEGKALLLQTGTTLKYAGEEGCQQQSYEQYVKATGLVILPETKANVYHLVEMWGRDSETVIARLSPPNGDVFIYDLGVEYQFIARGPVGTYREFTEPETGNTLRYVIVGDGITRTLPTGEVFHKLLGANTYCTSCGSQWALMESWWLSPDLFSPVLLKTESENTQCPGTPRRGRRFRFS